MSNPDPMRAFKGLSVNEAKQLGEKMGYRVIISATGVNISSIPPVHIDPKTGELGLYLNLDNTVGWAETAKSRAKEKPGSSLLNSKSPRPDLLLTPISPRFDLREGIFTRIPSGPPPLSHPVMPGRPTNPFSMYSSPPPNPYPTYAPITPAKPGFPAYYTASRSPDSVVPKVDPFSRYPVSALPPRTVVCASCKKDLTEFCGKGHSISNPCPHCKGLFCLGCHAEHTTCHGKPVQPPLIVPGG